MPRCLEDINDEPSISASRTITAEDVEAFGDLTWDWTEIHFSEEAARASQFGRRIAHGAFVFSASLGLVLHDEVRRPDVLALIGVDRLRFSRPVFLGDSIRVRQTVRSRDPLNAESGILEAKEEILNQDDVVVMSYTARILVRRRAAAGEPAASA